MQVSLFIVLFVLNTALAAFIIKQQIELPYFSLRVQVPSVQKRQAQTKK